MKSFVLMNRKTGDLFEGHRVWLLDGVASVLPGVAEVWTVFGHEHHGWIVYSPHPSFAGQRLWFNRKGVEKFFANLGEL